MLDAKDWGLSAELSGIPGEFAEIHGVAVAAFEGVLRNRFVLEEELAHPAKHIGWPQPDPKTPYERMLHEITEAGIEIALEGLAVCDRFLGRPKPETQEEVDAAVHAILQVCVRARAAADKAARSRFPGRALARPFGRKGLSREYFNWLKGWRVQRLVDAGLTKVEAAARLGIGRSAAFEMLRKRQ